MTWVSGITSNQVRYTNNSRLLARTHVFLFLVLLSFPDFTSSEQERQAQYVFVIFLRFMSYCILSHYLVSTDVRYSDAVIMGSFDAVKSFPLRVMIISDLALRAV